jgi:hypothetical protein
MVVLPSTVASHYHNCGIDGSTSPGYFGYTHVHVSGLLVGYHQEVTMYICNNWYVLYRKEDCLILPEYLHVIIKCEKYSCYLNLLKGIGKLSMLLPPDDGLLSSLKHVKV